VFDAQGMSVNEIAERTGLTRQTVSTARNQDERYLAERARHLAEALAPLARVIEEASVESLDAMRRAIKVLGVHLSAEIDGAPLYGVQAEAAKILLNHPAIRRLYADPADSTSAAIAVSAVTIVVKDGNTIEVTPVEEAEVEVHE
jgi:transcriptional regulator with XRE-family HTH domain